MSELHVIVGDVVSWAVYSAAIARREAAEKELAKLNNWVAQWEKESAWVSANMGLQAILMKAEKRILELEEALLEARRA